MTQQLQLPQEAQDRLNRIHEMYKIPMQQLLSETEKEFSEEFIQTHAALRTEEDKLNYATKVVLGRYNTRSSLDNYDVIVWGIGKARTKPNSKSCEVYVIVEEYDKSGKPVIARAQEPESTHQEKYTVVFRDKDVDNIVPTIQPRCMYTVPLATGKAKQTFFADDRSIFENPIKVDISWDELLKTANIKRCTIAEVPNNLAKEEKTSTGTYPDRLDMRVIRGMIGDYRKGGNPGEEWAFYIISDDSVKEEGTTADGEITIKPSLIVFVNPMWLVLERNNIADFVGTLGASTFSKGKKLDPPYDTNMAGALVIPIIAPYGEIKNE